MIWKKIKIKTKTEATDIVASVLFDFGVVGVEIEDNVNLTSEELKKMYVDIPIIRNDDGIAYVNFYISIVNEKEKNEILSKKINIDKDVLDDSYIMSTDNMWTLDEYEKRINDIKNELENYKSFSDLGELTFSEENLDDKIFLNKWKENFKRIDIDDISIIPSFDKNEILTKKLNVYIEPGSAFGTGQHETTKLCIKNIVEVFKEKGHIENFLDIGTGSGILSIIAYKLGAKNVYAVDVDSSTEENLLENLKLNDVKLVDKNVGILSNLDIKKYAYEFGNIITDEKLMKKLAKVKYDVITINILAPIIISMFEKAKVYELLGNFGKIILSGIIKEKANEVLKIVNKYLKVASITYENDWVSVVAKN